MATFTDTTVEDPKGLAVLVPGIAYPVQMPQLYFAKQVALANGWSVREIAWEPGMEWTTEAVAGEFEKAIYGVDLPILIMGKSIGSLSSVVAAEKSLPAVWITPVLEREDAVRAIGANAAKQLVIGGTADVDHWDSDASKTWPENVEVLEFDGADHSTLVAGDPVRSGEIAAEYTKAMHEWLQAL